MKLLVATGAAALSLLVLDGVWLWLMAPTYRRLLSGAMIDTIRLAPAIAFYVLYIMGVVVLLVQPALASGEPYVTTAFRAALFGLVAYATYSLTNFATLKVYSGQLAALDLVWGPVLTAIAAVVSVAAARYAGG